MKKPTKETVTQWYRQLSNGITRKSALYTRSTVTSANTGTAPQPSPPTDYDKLFSHYIEVFGRDLQELGDLKVIIAELKACVLELSSVIDPKVELSRHATFICEMLHEEFDHAE